MEWQAAVTISLTAATLLTLSFSSIPPHVVLMSTLTLLSLFGILTAEEALSGFSDPGLITVAAMFIVACGVHHSGAIDIFVNKLLGKPDSERGALLRMFAPVVSLSAFLNNTPVVATMVPAIKAWSRQIGIAPSKLMIPLSYTAILGGTITLIGTSTNLIVNSQYQLLTGRESMPLFAITMVGLPVALLGLAFMWLVFPRWLPARGDSEAFANLREFTLEVMVDSNGPLVGKTILQAGLRNLRRIYLVEIEREGRIIAAVAPEERLEGGDRLVFAGDTEAIYDLLRIRGIVPSIEGEHADAIAHRHSERRLVEVVVSPHCGAIGSAIRDARFRDRYGAVVLAVARNGERVEEKLGSIHLTAGDTLLLEARPTFVTRQRFSKEFLLVSELDTEPPRYDKALLACLILTGLVVCAASGMLSMLNAALLGAGLMLVSGCCTISQAEKSLDLMVLITIAASFALGLAIRNTGVAAQIAEGLLHISISEPWILLIIIYFTVSLLTEIITNNTAAILMLPIVLDVTEKAGFNQEPFLLAVMMAASASFATPLGYQTNLMVYGPGGYKFSDFLKVGLPMNIFIGVATIAVLLIGWPLILV